MYILISTSVAAPIDIYFEESVFEMSRFALITKFTSECAPASE